MREGAGARVNHDFVLDEVADEPVNRQPGRLASDVPEGDVDRGKGVDGDTSLVAPAEPAAVEQASPELGRTRRVGAEKEAAERRLGSGKLRGGVEQRRHRAGPGGGGADTGDAGVGVDLDEGEVLGEAAADDADVGDLHGGGWGVGLGGGSAAVPQGAATAWKAFLFLSLLQEFLPARRPGVDLRNVDLRNNIETSEVRTGPDPSA